MNELEWLNDERPEVAAPDEETTSHARAALLAYAVGGERVPAGARRPSQATGLRPTGRMLLGPAVAPPQRGGRKGRRRPIGLFVTAAAVFGVAIVVVAGALPSGDDGPARQIAKHIGAPTAAEAAPLAKLSKRIQQLPAPTGDATLVLRSHDFPTATDFTGADLYLDDGRYYYGMTLDQLKAVGKADDLGEGVPKQERDAAIAANDLTPDQARERMLAASWPGNHKPAESETSPANLAKRAAIIKLKQPKGKIPPPASQHTIDNNRIWIAGMDTLIAGAGDAQVRAGVMKLLGTINAKVTDRGDTVEITDTDFSMAYQETIVVDARTGVIQKMIGGETGKTPEVTVTYDIKRVTASDIVPGS